MPGVFPWNLTKHANVFVISTPHHSFPTHFNANPMHTSASLAKRVVEKAAEKAKKAK